MPSWVGYTHKHWLENWMQKSIIVLWTEWIWITPIFTRSKLIGKAYILMWKENNIECKISHFRKVKTNDFHQPLDLLESGIGSSKQFLYSLRNMTYEWSDLSRGYPSNSHNEFSTCGTGHAAFWMSIRWSHRRYLCVYRKIILRRIIDCFCLIYKYMRQPLPMSSGIRLLSFRISRVWSIQKVK
jgi:hypothetical protein